MLRERVGSYELVRVLAHGGMAVVYLARQPALDRDVVLKRLQLSSDDSALAERFVREARLAAGLDHPNIVTLYDFFEHGGVPYIAMEYVTGGSLRRLVGKLNLPQVLGVLDGILAGLGHAEEREVVHRDLKPENVLVTRSGSAKIADFGIARAYNALTPSLTATGTTIGTPTYMAPEQVTGDPLGPYTDLYALGVIAYELLAGTPPFDPGMSPLSVLYCHVHTRPPPLGERATDAPASLCAWTEWLLAKAPGERPGSAVAAREALEEIAVDELGPYWRRESAITPDSMPLPTLEAEFEQHATPATTATTGAGEAPRRRRRAGIVAMVVALAVGGAAVLLLASVIRPDHPAPVGAPAAVPYDFNGDGRPELVLGMPRSGRSNAGVVVVMRPRDGHVITPSDAHVNGPYDGREGFGRSVASGDFDRDGRADLAIGVPGRARVAVMSGTPQGLANGPTKLVRSSEFRVDPGAVRYGRRLVVGDVNRDGFDDLVVGAPDADKGPSGSGIIQIFYGGRGGLGVATKAITRPEESLKSFGTGVRLGDLNGDGSPDVVEGAPDRQITGGGHASYCLGARRGFHTCRVLTGPVSSGTSALAVGDLNGDGYDDIVQGDRVVEAAAAGRSAAGGEVRVWFGDRTGVRRDPLIVDQSTTNVPGTDTAGDGFGESVGAGDLDHDGYADIVVASPGEHGGDGAVTIIRGGSEGLAHGANTTFAVGDGLPGRPGRAAGIGLLSVMDVAGDARPDVIVTAPGADGLRDAVFVLIAGKGAFAPGEARIWRPLGPRLAVPNPQIRDVRLPREAGS